VEEPVEAKVSVGAGALEAAVDARGRVGRAVLEGLGKRRRRVARALHAPAWWRRAFVNADGEGDADYYSALAEGERAGAQASAEAAAAEAEEVAQGTGAEEKAEAPRETERGEEAEGGSREEEEAEGGSREEGALREGGMAVSLARSFDLRFNTTLVWGAAAEAKDGARWPPARGAWVGAAAAARSSAASFVGATAGAAVAEAVAEASRAGGTVAEGSTLLRCTTRAEIEVGLPSPFTYAPRPLVQRAANLVRSTPAQHRPEFVPPRSYS